MRSSASTRLLWRSCSVPESKLLHDASDAVCPPCKRAAPSHLFPAQPPVPRPTFKSSSRPGIALLSTGVVVPPADISATAAQRITWVRIACAAWALARPPTRPPQREEHLARLDAVVPAQHASLNADRVVRFVLCARPHSVLVL